MFDNLISYFIGLLLSIIFGLIGNSLRKMRNLNRKEIISGALVAAVTWSIIFVLLQSLNFHIYDFIEYND